MCMAYHTDKTATKQPRFIHIISCQKRQRLSHLCVSIYIVANK